MLNEGWRYRDLETGTFITRDPLGFVDGPNMYAYVMQNPWTKFDPLGLSGDRPRTTSEARFDKFVKAGGAHTIGQHSKTVDTAAQVSTWGTVLAFGGAILFEARAVLAGAYGAYQAGNEAETKPEPSAPPPQNTAPEGSETPQQSEEEKPALPESYWKNKKAPDQVTPGTKDVADEKPSSRSEETYKRTTHYDEFGRSTGQTHETSHNEPDDHPNPHHHRRDPKTGQGIPNPSPPGKAKKVWTGPHPDSSSQSSTPAPPPDTSSNNNSNDEKD